MARTPVQPVAPLDKNAALQTEQFQASGGRFDTTQDRLLAALKLSEQKQQEQELLRQQAIQSAQGRESRANIERPIAGLIDTFSGGKTQLTKQLPTEAQAAQGVLSASKLPGSDPFKSALAVENARLKEEGLKLRDKLATDAAKKKAMVGSELNPTQRRLLDKDFKDTLNKLVAPKQRLLSLNLQNVRDAVASGSLPRVTAILGQIAKGISGEGARLTDQDITRVFPSNFGVQLAKLKAYFKDNPNEVKLPEGFTEYITQAIDTAQDNSKVFFGHLVEKEGKKLLTLKSFMPLKVDKTGDAFVKEFKGQLENPFSSGSSGSLSDRVRRLKELAR